MTDVGSNQKSRVILPPKYVLRYHQSRPKTLKKRVEDCTKLKELEQRSGVVGTAIEQMWKGSFQWTIGVAFTTIVVAVLGAAFFWSLSGFAERNTWLQLLIIASGALYIAILAAFVYNNVQQTLNAIRPRLKRELLRIALLLEENPQWWGEARFNRFLNGKFEACALLAEKLPSCEGITGTDRAAIDITRRCSQIAATFRGYKIKVAFPHEGSREELAEQAREGFRLMAIGRWFDLPRLRIRNTAGPTWRERLAYILLFLVVLSGLAAVAIYNDALGPISGPTASILAIVLVYVLSRLGVSISTLQQAADVADKVKPKEK